MFLAWQVLAEFSTVGWTFLIRGHDDEPVSSNFQHSGQNYFLQTLFDQQKYLLPWYKIENDLLLCAAQHFFPILSLVSWKLLLYIQYVTNNAPRLF